jgi:hypothetical protein
LTLYLGARKLVLMGGDTITVRIEQGKERSKIAKEMDKKTKV